MHRPLSRANRNAFYCSDFNKVPQKKCASTHDIKKRGLFASKMRYLHLEAVDESKKAKAESAPERTGVPRRVVSPVVVVTRSRGREVTRSRGHEVTRSRGHEVTRSRGHEARGPAERLEDDDEEGPPEKDQGGHQDQGELRPQVGRRTRGNFAELKKCRPNQSYGLSR